MGNPALTLVTEHAAPYAPPVRFTQVPNVVLHILPELGEAEARVLLAVVRETSGYHREVAEISFSEFEALTGLSRQSIGDAVKSLTELTAGGEVFFVREKIGRGYEYRVLVEPLLKPSVKQVDRSSSLTDVGQVSRPMLVKLLDRSYYKEVKERERKETKTHAEEEKARKAAEAKARWQAETRARFEAFWEAYDHKQDRKRAWSAWKNLSATKQAAALEAVPAYVGSTPERQYRKHPTTWLNGECWLNEIVAAEPEPVPSRLAIGEWQ